VVFAAELPTVGVEWGWVGRGGLGGVFSKATDKQTTKRNTPSYKSPFMDITK